MVRLLPSGAGPVGWSAFAALTVALAVLMPVGVPASGGQNGVLPLPAVVGSSTKGGERPSGKTTIECDNPRDVAWYRFAITRRGPVLVNVQASDTLDAVMGVFRERRSAIGSLGCRLTDPQGSAELAIWGKPRDTLVVGIGRRARSAAGTFKLTVQQAEPPATLPGTPASAVVSASLDALLNPDDAWSVTLTAGQPFRINLLSRTRDQCVKASLYRPQTVSFDEEYALGTVFGCEGRQNYLLFTPGPDGGGLYTLHVTASPEVKGPQAYRLITAPAAKDDFAPGIELQNGADLRGSLFGRGIDVVDLYSFSVGKPSLFRAELLTQPRVHFDIDLIGRHGSVIGTLHSERPGRLLRFRQLNVGLYYLAVQSVERSGGHYQLQVSVREFTTTQMTIDGNSSVESTPGTAHLLTATVTPPGYGGIVRFQLDRFDPLSGWQFVGFVNAEAGTDGTASTSWTPPSSGSWRIRARFMGTTDASVSQSRPVKLFVGPLPTAG